MDLAIIKKHLRLWIAVESWLTNSALLHDCDLERFYQALDAIFEELGYDLEEQDIWQCAMFDVAKDCYPEKIDNLTSEIFNDSNEAELTHYQRKLKVHIEKQSKTAIDIASYLNHMGKVS